MGTMVSLSLVQVGIFAFLACLCGAIYAGLRNQSSLGWLAAALSCGAVGLLIVSQESGFLAEWMQIYLAEGLTPGDTSPDEDERIELFFVPLSELLRLIDKGEIHDAKTIIAATLYARIREKAKRG